ncbi:uncharacterized protein BcabD6B2_38780 [Babesia caballi]|uniref:Uncharacterized protein n=1 Tax=Babesia caballi TaxID=5871 RepID=A0AAV4LXG3_BABCB|nr:hypothetical protein BcabD6B2_38780 [Babesia caballi]
MTAWWSDSRAAFTKFSLRRGVGESSGGLPCDVELAQQGLVVEEGAQFLAVVGQEADFEQEEQRTEHQPPKCDENLKLERGVRPCVVAQVNLEILGEALAKNLEVVGHERAAIENCGEMTDEAETVYLATCTCGRVRS